MNAKYCRTHSFLHQSWRVLFGCLVILSISHLYAAPLKFAVLSDSHIYEKNHGQILELLLQKIQTTNSTSPTPIKYIVVNGDMVFNHQKYGPQTPETYKRHLDTFFDLLQSGLKDTGIKLMMGRGNHDNHYTDEGDHKPYNDVYHSVLQKYNDLLAVTRKGNDNPNYHFVDGEVSFVMLNMISINKNDLKESKADIQWLKTIKAETKPTTFLFAHYPPFSANKKTYSMVNSNELLDLMAKNGYKYYISGHDHIFTHSILEKKNKRGKVTATVHQLVCPHSAGKFFSRIYTDSLYAQNPGNWEARLYTKNATFTEKKPGFLIVEVNEGTVRVSALNVDVKEVYAAEL